MDGAAFEKRIAKRFEELSRWAARERTNAFRIYDSDLPHAPWTVDWYAGRVVAAERVTSHAMSLSEAELASERAAAVAAIGAALKISEEAIFVKRRAAHAVRGKIDSRSDQHVVEENGLRFEVNLSDYLDTGLFLDHRPLRRRVGAIASGKRVLNLFCYTGAFTVHAAAGGARETVSVDLSKTYLAWAERNLALNKMTSPKHRFVCADAIEFLERERGAYDVIVLDPPTTSRSKRGTEFDVRADHPKLLAAALALVAPGGVLFFSTNAHGFALDAIAKAKARDISTETTPLDFRAGVHRCWEISR